MGAILEACTFAEPWPPADLIELLSVLGEPWVRMPPRLGPLLASALDELTRSDLELVQPHLILVAHRFDGLEPGDRARVERHLPEPKPIDQELRQISPADPWGRAVRSKARDVDVDADAAPAILRLAYDCVREAEDEWLVEFDALSDRKGVGRLLELLVQAPLGFRSQENEHRASGAARLIGMLARLSTEPASHAQTAVLLEKLALWGATWNFNRPNSNSVARGAVAGLAHVPGDASVVALHRLLERFPNRAGLSKDLEHALTSRSEDDRTLTEVVAAGGPTFGLDAAGTRCWSFDSGVAKVEVLDGRAVIVNDEAVPSEHLVEVREVADQVNRQLGVLRRRYDNHLRDLTVFSPSEFAALASGSPLTAALAKSLLWRFYSAAEHVTGFVDGGGEPRKIDSNEPIPPWTSATLWHPALSDEREIAVLEDWVLSNEVTQATPQVFRERYGRNQDVLGELPLKAKKADGILRSRGWRLSGLGGWDGGSEGTARRTHPSGGCIAEVQWTVPLLDGGGPRFAGSWCLFGSLAVSHAEDCDDDALAVFSSEVRRDLELLTTVAAPTGKMVTDPESPFHPFALASFGQPLNGAGVARRRVLRWLIDEDVLDTGRWELTDRALLVHGRGGAFRIDLNTGLLLSPKNELLSKTGSRSLELPWLPFGATGTLGRIIRVAASVK